MTELFEYLKPILPIDFFASSHQVPYLPPKRVLKHLKSRDYALPDTSSLLDEKSFATVFLGWNEEGIHVAAEVRIAFQESEFPQFDRGDSWELFFDTHDLKTTSRFCHHFLILPDEMQSIRCREITSFRTEDTHSLCDSSEIVLHTEFGVNNYEMRVFFPTSCLHGYDPSAFSRMGFTYKLNRLRGDPQHFSLSSKTYSIPRQPGLWATLDLLRK